MNFSNGTFERAVKALSAVYHLRKQPDIGESWTIGVMTHIQKLGPLSTDTSLVFSNHFMWRFVPAVCVLIAMLTLLLSQEAFDPAYEITKIFFNDPIEYAVTQSWSV